MRSQSVERPSSLRASIWKSFAICCRWPSLRDISEARATRPSTMKSCGPVGVPSQPSRAARGSAASMNTLSTTVIVRCPARTAAYTANR
jgi:hypothetical protein